MQITLIRPPAVTNTGLKGQIAALPLGLAYVAGTLRNAGHQLALVDAVGAAPDSYRAIPGTRNAVSQGLSAEEVAARVDPHTELVGISLMFSVEWPYDRETIAAVRRRLPGVPIVVGGEHATSCWRYILETCADVDYCVVGEGEASMAALCAALAAGEDATTLPGVAARAGGRPRFTPRPRIRDVDAIPPPDWSLFDLAVYQQKKLTWGVDLGLTMPILASRGCPFRCAFCTSSGMWGTLWRPRDPQLVIAEMKRYIRDYGATAFALYDLTPIVRKRQIIAFAEGVLAEGLDIRWQMSSGTRPEAIDERVARLLHRSGCRNLNLAPESGSRTLLARCHKTIDLDEMVATVRVASKAQLRVKANIIFGFPDETFAEALDTVKLMVRMALAGADDAGAFNFALFPGSGLFDKLAAEGRVALDERYFHQLLAFTDPANEISFARNLTVHQLALLTMGSMALFYGVSYLRRPWRALALVRDLLIGSGSSKLAKQITHAKRKQDAILSAMPSSRWMPTPLREAHAWLGVLRGHHPAVAADPLTPGCTAADQPPVGSARSAWRKEARSGARSTARRSEARAAR